MTGKMLRISIAAATLSFLAAAAAAVAQSNPSGFPDPRFNPTFSAPAGENIGIVRDDENDETRQARAREFACMRSKQQCAETGRRLEACRAASGLYDCERISSEQKTACRASPACEREQLDQTYSATGGGGIGIKEKPQDSRPAR
jgi:hypothetical protein